MRTSSNTAVLDEIFEPVTQCLTLEVARRIASLRATPKLQDRLDELADKCSEGTLSDDERDEYESRVRALNFIGVLQAQARDIVHSNTAS